MLDFIRRKEIRAYFHPTELFKGEVGLKTWSVRVCSITSTCKYLYLTFWYPQQRTPTPMWHEVSQQRLSSVGNCTRCVGVIVCHAKIDTNLWNCAEHAGKFTEHMWRWTQLIWRYWKKCRICRYVNLSGIIAVTWTISPRTLLSVCISKHLSSSPDHI